MAVVHGQYLGESEWADPNWKSFERLFDDTMLEGAKGRGKRRGAIHKTFRN